MKKVIQTAIAAINKNSVRRPTCHRLALDLLTAGMLVSGSFNQGDLSDKGLFSDASKLRLYRQELEIELERNRNELLLVGALESFLPASTRRSSGSVNRNNTAGSSGFMTVSAGASELLDLDLVPAILHQLGQFVIPEVKSSTDAPELDVDLHEALVVAAECARGRWNRLKGRANMCTGRRRSGRPMPAYSLVGNRDCARRNGASRLYQGLADTPWTHRRSGSIAGHRCQQRVPCR